MKIDKKTKRELGYDQSLYWREEGIVNHQNLVMRVELIIKTR